MPRSWIETFDLAKLFDRSLAERAVLALVATLLAPVCEEIAFRGYLQTTLLARRAPAVAIAGVDLAVRDHPPRPGPLPRPPRARRGVRVARLALGLALAGGRGARGEQRHRVALRARRPARSEEVEHPPALAILGALALGAAALAPLLAAFRTVASGPIRPEAAIALRDPSDPSIRFRLRRVPARLHVAIRGRAVPARARPRGAMGALPGPAAGGGWSAGPGARARSLRSTRAAPAPSSSSGGLPHSAIVSSTSCFQAPALLRLEERVEPSRRASGVGPHERAVRPEHASIPAAWTATYRPWPAGAR